MPQWWANEKVKVKRSRTQGICDSKMVRVITKKWWSDEAETGGSMATQPQGIQVTEPERVKTRREPRDNRVDKSSISAGECSSDPSGEVGWMGVTWGSLVRKKPGIYI